MADNGNYMINFYFSNYGVNPCIRLGVSDDRTRVKKVKTGEGLINDNKCNNTQNTQERKREGNIILQLHYQYQ